MVYPANQLYKVQNDERAVSLNDDGTKSYSRKITMHVLQCFASLTYFLRYLICRVSYTIITIALNCVQLSKDGIKLWQD